MMVFYRGDNRKPEEIKKAGGFKARTERALDLVRSELISCCTSNNLADLSQKIRNGAVKDRYISTDETEECGGYSSQEYIYKISFPFLRKQPWDEKIIGENINIKVNSFTPELYLDSQATKLKDATIIALKNYANVTKEVTFLTPIPLANITHYKKKGETNFVDMSRA